MKSRYPFYFLLFLFLLSFESSAQQANWTHFRGNKLNGISESANPPVKWSADSYIRWKTDLTGKGWSSPVVLGDQVWLTLATDDGKSMKAVCLDFKTDGKPVWKRTDLN